MTATGRLRVAVGLLVCDAMWVPYAHRQPPGQQPAALDVIKIADDLYVIHNDIAPGNSTALITSEGVVLVDDKFAIDHDNIMAELNRLTNKPLRYVINTHHHADHAGGNARMQQMNVAVIASEQAREHMSEGPPDGMFGGAQSGFPNVTFEHHLSLRLGDTRVELYQFGRGHTNGDVVVYFPAARTLAAGDLFTFGDATPQLIDYAAGGSAKEWTRTLDSATVSNPSCVSQKAPLQARERRAIPTA
jgi:cyclase